MSKVTFHRFAPFIWIFSLLIYSPAILAQCSLWPTSIPARCANAPAFTLAGGTPTPGSYFGPGVVLGVFYPSVAGPGSHVVKYKANSCTDTASKTIVVNPVTTPTLSGLDTAYCINNNPQIIAMTGAPTGGTYSGPGVTGSNFNIGLAGVGNHTIRYIFTNGSSCTDTANKLVHVRALPTVTLSIPSTQKFVCEFDGPFAIAGASPNPGWPSSWFTGQGVDSLLGTFEPDPSLLGWNVITYHYYNGFCLKTVVDSINVQENPTVTLTDFPVVCINQPAFQLTQGSGSPTGGSQVYSGTGVSGGPISYFFTASTAGIGVHPISYCYTATNGCSTCVTQNLTVVDIPTVFFNQIKPSGPGVCVNDGPIDLSNPSRGVPAGGYYSGVGIQTDSITLKPSQMGGPGTYTLTYTYVDTNGCQNTASRPVTVYPSPAITITALSPLPTPNPPTDPADVTIKICLGDTAITSISSTPSHTIPPQVFPDDNSYTKVGGEFHFHPVIDAGYEVIIIADNGCIDTGFITIDVIPLALAVISGDTDLCIGDTTTLTASGATSYTWVNPTSTSVSITVSPKANTIYQVVADSDVDGDGNKCSTDTGDVSLEVHPLPLITSGRDTTVFYGDEVVLKAYGGVTYVWTEGVQGELSCYACASPIAFPLYQKNGAAFRWYYVTGTDSNGCVNGDTLIVNLNAKIVVFIPNAFSPNEDGVNDELKVETKGIASIVFEVYDRFGHVVYESTEIDDSWNGEFNGELLPKDVYFYKLMAYPYEKVVTPISQAGEITILR